jgi:tetratricopeptide (TPR) repeat protein/tRNA A-37 threonylcarbamoyl transferase component Bud32
MQASLASLPPAVLEASAPPTRQGASEDSAVVRTRPPSDQAPADVFATVAPTPGAAPAAGRYRRLREHARGGLGEVFVALDQELSREVALKEIQDRFADHPDARARFLREAEVTGKLEHPGVVPVYGLGAYLDGRPYYAMRFIRGESMHEAIQRFHTADEDPRRDPGERSLALRELLGRFVAVCNAVAYAHSRGVLHRDLKPANAMLGEYGETLVVDWGLARLLEQPEGDQTAAERPVQLGGGSVTAPTEMGQVVGTPSFMAPEQAEGRLDLMGRASDVFALGATLYALLTGQPPYIGQDVQAQARRGEVVAARQRKASVSAALEAVCQKAMAKRPEDRYPTAQALADEVQRWLAGEPVKAWPEPWVVKAGRLVRRHRVLATSVMVGLLVALVLGAAGGVYWQQQRQWARNQAGLALDRAVELRQRYRFTDARAMLEQAREWASRAHDSDLQARLAQTEREVALAHDLDDVRQKAAIGIESKWGNERKREEYPQVLDGHGFDVLGSDQEELARAICASAVRDDIVAALDEWAAVVGDRQKRQYLLRLANLVDQPDPWREAVRLALIREDVKGLRQLVRNTGQGKPTPAVVLLLASAFGEESAEPPTDLLREMQRERPGDFWVSFAVASRFYHLKKYPEAADSLLLAVALRPDSAWAHTNLGVALAKKGDVDAAIACWRKAIALEPKHALARYNLGVALKDKGEVDAAIVCWRKAIAIDPKDAKAHYNLGAVLAGKGEVGAAIVCYRKAIALDPKLVLALDNLGLALMDKGDVDAAIACFKKVIDLDPKLAPAHANLGNALMGKGEVDAAIACFKKAIALDPKHVRAHTNLGVTLAGKGEVDPAIACHKKAIELDPKYAPAHYNLGAALERKGEVGAAIACYRKAIALDPKHAPAHYNLGVALAGKGEVDAAIACWRKAIALDPKDAQAHTNLGVALAGKGEVGAAIACYRKAIALDPKYANAHGAMGLALGQQGQFREACKALRRCLDLLPPGNPRRGFTSRLLQQAQQSLEAEDKLKAFVAGKIVPAAPATLVQMAALAQQPYNRLYLTSTRLYCDAFARQPALARAHGYNAACAAALAGRGLGKDVARPDDLSTAELRYCGLCWLHDDLYLYANLLPRLPTANVQRLRQTLLHWQKEPDLADVRDPAALSKLPEAEQVAWLNLWAQVDALLRRTSPGK